jgi:hypothetical protein
MSTVKLAARSEARRPPAGRSYDGERPGSRAAAAAPPAKGGPAARALLSYDSGHQYPSLSAAAASHSGWPRLAVPGSRPGIIKPRWSAGKTCHDATKPEAAEHRARAFRPRA